MTWVCEQKVVELARLCMEVEAGKFIVNDWEEEFQISDHMHAKSLLAILRLVLPDLRTT